MLTVHTICQLLSLGASLTPARHDSETDGSAAWDNSTLRQRVCEELRSRMMTGALPPGTRVPEARLADELQVSRGTVREAMRQLQTERLIVWEPRRSPHVRRLTTAEIEDIYEVRELLEGGAARTLAGLRSRDRDQAVAMLRAAYSRLQAAASESMAARISAELLYHETLCSLAGNELLLQLWQNLRPVVQLMLHCVPEPVLQELSVEDHLELIDAIEAGEPALAFQVVAGQFGGGATLLSPYVAQPSSVTVRRQRSLGRG
ncbi:MAG: GntR family transcriptional regulator [Streptosporangiaceae bacterium]